MNNINKLSVHLFLCQCHGETMSKFIYYLYNYAELKSELQGTKADEWHSIVGNYIMKKNKHNEEEKKRLEEQYRIEKQTNKG